MVKEEDLGAGQLLELPDEMDNVARVSAKFRYGRLVEQQLFYEAVDCDKSG